MILPKILINQVHRAIGIPINPNYGALVIVLNYTKHYAFTVNAKKHNTRARNIYESFSFPFRFFQT